MHDRSEIAVAKQRCGEPAVGEVEPVKSEVLELAKDGEPCLLERRIVIGVDVVDADDRPAAFKQPARQAKADEARGAGDQNRIVRHRIPWRKITPTYLLALDLSGTSAIVRRPEASYRGRASISRQ